MVYQHVLHIISMVTLAIIPPNFLNWDPQSDLRHYNNMSQKLNSNQATEYSVVSAYLNAALSRKEYFSILEEISDLTKKASKWVLLQEINIEGAYFCSYYLGMEKENSEGIRVHACLNGSKRTFNRSKFNFSKDEKIKQKIFSNNLSEVVDISVYTKDGTMSYITIADENNLRRLAVYNLEKHEKNDITEIVTLIKLIASTPL